MSNFNLLFVITIFYRNPLSFSLGFGEIKFSIECLDFWSLGGGEGCVKRSEVVNSGFQGGKFDNVLGLCLDKCGSS